jgi:hypothetical protein
MLTGKLWDHMYILGLSAKRAGPLGIYTAPFHDQPDAKKDLTRKKKPQKSV